MKEFSLYLHAYVVWLLSKSKLQIIVIQKAMLKVLVYPQDSMKMTNLDSHNCR